MRQSSLGEGWGDRGHAVVLVNIGANSVAGFPGLARRLAGADLKIGGYTTNSGRDSVVTFEGVVDVVGGDGPETADAPVIAAEFHDGGGHHTVSFAAIEDQRDAIAELGEDFFAAGAGAWEKS